MLRAARPTALLHPLRLAAMCKQAAANSGDAAGGSQAAAAAGAAPAAASTLALGRAPPPPDAPPKPAPKRQRLLPGAPAPGESSNAKGGKGGRGSSGASKGGASKGGGSRLAYKEAGPGLTQLPGGGALELRTDLLAPAAAAALFESLRRELPWEHRQVRVMGRQVAQPRLIAYQADGPELQARALRCGCGRLSGVGAGAGWRRRDRVPAALPVRGAGQLLPRHAPCCLLLHPSYYRLMRLPASSTLPAAPRLTSRLPHTGAAPRLPYAPALPINQSPLETMGSTPTAAPRWPRTPGTPRCASSRPRWRRPPAASSTAAC